MGQVVFEVRDRIAYITIHNESKRNAVNSAMGKELASAWDRIERDDDIRVAVLTGAGDIAFCSGGDMSEYLENGLLGDGSVGINRTIPKPTGLSKVVIAAINGYCFAGGFGLAMTCDLRIASRSAKLGPTGVKRGAMPGAEQSQRLARHIPIGKALEVLLFSRALSAEEAERWGIVNLVVEPDALMDAATEWATYLAGKNPVAVDNTKRAVYEGVELPYDEAVRLETELFLESTRTAGAKEGFEAFVQGRSK